MLPFLFNEVLQGAKGSDRVPTNDGGLNFIYVFILNTLNNISSGLPTGYWV
jgi:hypothetical protein